MGKGGGLIIDVLTGPAKDAEEEPDEMLDEDEPPPAASGKGKASPQTIIAGIEAQLAQLRGLL